MIIRMWKWDSKKTSACKVFCCIQKFDESNLHVKKKFERPKKEHRKVESNLKWFTRSEEMWQQLWNMFIYLKSKLGMINKFRFFFFLWSINLKFSSTFPLSCQWVTLISISLTLIKCFQLFVTYFTTYDSYKLLIVINFPLNLTRQKCILIHTKMLVCLQFHYFLH